MKLTGNITKIKSFLRPIIGILLILQKTWKKWRITRNFFVISSISAFNNLKTKIIWHQKKNICWSKLWVFAYFSLIPNKVWFIRYFHQSRILMPCPFTGPKMFCASPNFLSQPKNLTAFSASSKSFVPAQKTILLNANQLFVWHKMFVTATICK